MQKIQKKIANSGFEREKITQQCLAKFNEHLLDILSGDNEMGYSRC